ncbi:hypothetical protein [Ekhidna sp.]
MTLIMNSPLEMEAALSQVDTQDELTICIDSDHEQESPMEEDQKAKVSAESPSLYALFQKTLEVKGEYPLENCEWNGEKELQADNLSSMTLHSFILKAQSLGKKITYAKSLRIKISD